MAEPRDPLDQPEEFDLEFMDCPVCGEVAEIGKMSSFTTEQGEDVFCWRTLCLSGHCQDNYWFTTPACDDEIKPDVTPPRS